MPEPERSMLLIIMASTRTFPAAFTKKPSSEGSQSLAMACNASHRVSCVAYADGDISTRVQTHLKLIKPQDYLHAGHEAPHDCCNFSDRRRTPRKAAALGGSIRTEGTTFFCEAHRAKTLAAQYRFLPALAHARNELVRAKNAKHVGSHRQRQFDWMVLLDDDSEVNINALFAQLDGLDHTKPTFAGDIVSWDQPPPWDLLGHFSLKGEFACGGAGLALSRQAVLQADFEACAQLLHQGCYQSDWMVGQCLKQYGVMPLHHLSCGLCRNYCSHRMKGCKYTHATFGSA